MCANVLVMMSTYNGEKYINEQIESVFAQENVNVSLLVRDDGSSDATVEILESYKKNGYRIDFYTGDNLKPALSFLDLIFRVKDFDKYDYYAFCDQDDYWLKDKLSIAVNHLAQMEHGVPLLYYGKTQLVDKNLTPFISKRNTHVNSSSFQQAIICSNATGCTMCFNSLLLKIAQLYRPQQIMMHDGWMHKLCLAMGGEVFYDSVPHIYYRQHGGNVVGGTSSFMSRILKHYSSFRNRKQMRKKMVQELYKGYGDLMPEENRKLCELYINYDVSFINKMKILFSKTDLNNFRISLFFKLSIFLNVF